MEKTYRILKILIWVLVFAVVLAGAWVLYNNLSSRVELAGFAVTGEGTDPADQTRTPAPDVTVYDADGNPHSLSDFRGKPVILNFWASWCGPCKSEMPQFQSAWEAYGEDIHFMMVNMTDGRRETVDKAQAYLEQGGYTFPAYFDTQMEAAYGYSVMSIPATYFIDAQGGLVTAARGALDADRLQKGIDLLLDEE